MTSTEATLTFRHSLVPSIIEQYNRASVEVELVKLLPNVTCKGLRFDLWYVDNLAGEVSVYCCTSICTG